MTMMKRILMTALLPAALFFLASPAFSYTWTVSVPSDVKFEEAHIWLYADGCKKSSGEKIIKKGHSYTWSSDKPFCDIGGNYGYMFVHQTCDGVDHKEASGPLCKTSCANNIRVKVCPKVAVPTGFYGLEYGFCPD
jgi:hypothetical protein